MLHARLPNVLRAVILVALQLLVTLGGPILEFTALETHPCACSLPHELCVKQAEREFQKAVHGV